MTALAVREILSTPDDVHYLQGRDPVEAFTQSTALVRTDNLTRRGTIARLVTKLRPREVRELAIDVLDQSLEALERGDWEMLRVAVVSWLETADALASTRKRGRAVAAAREEGRQFLGPALRPAQPERRQVPR